MAHGTLPLQGLCFKEVLKAALAALWWRGGWDLRWGGAGEPQSEACKMRRGGGRILQSQEGLGRRARAGM